KPVMEADARTTASCPRSLRSRNVRPPRRAGICGLLFRLAAGGLADEGLAVLLVLDLVGEQQIELALVARLHGRALDDHAGHRTDVLGEPALRALEDLKREAARGKRRRVVAELRGAE